MHIQEVFTAIYDNHLYDYFVINREFKVIGFSEKVNNYCILDTFNEYDTDIFMAIPELIGMELDFDNVFEGLSNTVVLPMVFKEPNYYLNIRIHKGREREGNRGVYESLIILFENVTVMALAEQNSLQERHEKTLLLAQLAEKNLQLEKFNEEMHKLVALRSRHAQMGEMIGMITHQWKQPLSAINMNCGFLQMKYQSGMLKKEQFDKKMKNILQQSEYMNKTIADFQNFFNPSKKKANFYIMETINSIISLVQTEYSINDIALILEGDESAMAYGYANEYNQVVLSILQNAKEALLEKRHKSMEIRIKVEKTPLYSAVSISDNAGGIPDEIIKTIFDLYMTTKVKGSGLGLNIAKRMIEENMEGRLSVKNTKEGAEFCILL